ncbi:uncharacterized protein V6R79_000679 [Siganus canaliculatus]
MSSVTEEIPSSSHQDHRQETNEKPLSCLPPLPHVHSFLPLTVPPPSDQVYLQAAAIFQQLRTEKAEAQQLLHYGKKTDAPQPESGDKATQRQAYQLAFNTLKYQDLLEDIITGSSFHTSQHIPDDLLPLVMVMLFDFQDRSFLLRSSKEKAELLQEVRDLEQSLYRVKQKLQSVSCFLTDPVRTKQHRTKHLPLHAWVNTLKTSVEEVCDVLKKAGVCEVQNMADLQESTFCRDPLCPDTLVFSQQLRGLLHHSSLTATHTLNMSVCVAVSVLRPLLFENGDVLVAGSFSALTVAHIAVAATARSGHVLVCGADHTPSQREDMTQQLTLMGITNVRVLSEAFCGLDEWDAAVQRLKVVMVLPRCSSSALNDPVPTIHSEHGNWDLLPDLSHSCVSKTKLHKLTMQQTQLLAHALSFPKVQTVVYCTRSVYPEENEQLVKRVLEKVHAHHKLLPFRVNGPIFPDAPQPGNAADSKFFQIEPSELSNGCFMARLSRQADPTKVETVQDVLARAAAKGLLGGIIPEPSKTGKKAKSKKNHAASATSRLSSPSSQEREPGEDVVKGEGSEEDEKEDGKEGKGEKKRRGLKGKVKRPRHSNKKGSKKKPTKGSINKSHYKRRLTKSKPRRIPRLTLTLMSSTKASNHLSPITALAHKLSNHTAAKPQQQASPAGTALPTPSEASKKAKNQNPEPQKTPTDTTKPGRQAQARGRVVKLKTEVKTQDVSKPADLVLPPISVPSPSSASSRSGVSRLHRPAQRSTTQHVQESASPSSSFSLPAL